jgi:hypothetical protein
MLESFDNFHELEVLIILIHLMLIMKRDFWL